MTLLVDGAFSTSLVVLTAAGLIIAYGWFGVINMAHGDLITVGAYACAIAVSLGMPFTIAVFSGAAVAGTILWVGDLTLLRFLRARGELPTLLGTWGLGIVLTESIRLAFGPQGRFVDAPFTRTLSGFDVDVPLYHVALISSAAVLTIALAIFAKGTLAGIRLRAALDNPNAADGMGINRGVLTGTSFFVAGSLAGAAGALLAPIAPVTPVMGRGYAAIAFVVVILGGHGLVPGPLFAALFIGAIRTSLQAIVDPATATFLTLAIAILATFGMHAIAWARR